MSLTFDKKADLLYDHYKDTYNSLQKKISERNKVFLYLIILTFLTIFSLQNLLDITHITEGFTESYFKLNDLVIGKDLVNSIILLIYLYFIIRYCQLNISINRLYEYIHSKESTLQKEPYNIEISREGLSYLEAYPWILQFIHWIYTLFFPFFIITVIIWKWKLEFNLYIKQLDNFYFLLNTSVSMLITVSIVLYMLWIHFKDFNKNE